MTERLDRIKAGMEPEPLSPEDFATFMADCVASNETREGMREDGLKLMAALLTDLGYAKGVLIYGEANQWYDA